MSCSCHNNTHLLVSSSALCALRFDFTGATTWALGVTVNPMGEIGFSSLSAFLSRVIEAFYCLQMWEAFLLVRHDLMFADQFALESEKRKQTKENGTAFIFYLKNLYSSTNWLASQRGPFKLLHLNAARTALEVSLFSLSFTLCTIFI